MSVKEAHLLLSHARCREAGARDEYKHRHMEHESRVGAVRTHVCPPGELLLWLGKRSHYLARAKGKGCHTPRRRHTTVMEE